MCISLYNAILVKFGASTRYFLSLSLIMIYDIIYLLITIGFPPGGSSTVHIYTQTIYRTTQNKQYVEQHKKIWESAGRAPLLWVIGEKARKDQFGRNMLRIQ
jgi:hypothetical protein